ncbi:hypothetical protein M422DRAFT_251659 [Sphaerobolus stellatus SS14]|uniref:CCHC-type domain-containing protein n=1 Tax=Sphaerobolus stellatus (strain SS14) TaxID=990650 RepID=A0A0C9UQ32_SPHS4|nr:hypothetical protein M422DRAFT_251659 [Sphaerobolus stellatus SS14]
MKFRKGLSKSLRTQIATSEPAPRLNSLDEWVNTARSLADAWKTNKPSVPIFRPFMSPHPAMFPTPSAPACIPEAPVPMDVDRARGRTTVSNLVCRCCGKIGHIAKFCNADFNIRALTTDKKTELLYQLMADLDMAEQL